MGQKLLRAYSRKLQLNPNNNPYDPPFQTHGPNSTCKLAAPATQRSVQETCLFCCVLLVITDLLDAQLARHNHADHSERVDTVGGEHLEVEPGVAEEVQPAETLATEPNVLTYDDEKPPEHQEGGCVEPSEAAAADEEEGDHDRRDGDRKHGDALGQLGEGHRRTP